MRRQFFSLGLVLIVIAALVACATPTETPEPTAVSTVVSTAVPTAVPTVPPPPTRTPTPTPLPIPLDVELDGAVTLDRFLPQETFSIHFNQPMDIDSVDVPLLFSPFLEGVIQWDERRTKLGFAPLERFEPGQSYLVVLDKELASADGQFFDRLP